MSRRICFILAASLSLAGFNLAPAQEAASSAAVSNAAPESTDVATLQAENVALKKEVADAAQTIAKLQAQLGQQGAQPAATATPTPPAGPQKALPIDSTNFVAAPGAPATPGAPAADAGPSRSYTVTKGDSLWKIAHKMYPGDTKNGVDKIQEANKDAIGGKPLKIGQVLVIPQ